MILQKMIPISKVPRQSVSSSLMERKKRDREKERSRLSAKRNIPPDAKERYGVKFQTKICELMLSDDPTALEQLQAMHAELLAYYEEHNLTEMWLSDDENEGKQMKAPISKKMHHDVKVIQFLNGIFTNNSNFLVSEQRPISLSRLKSTSLTSSSVEEKDKLKNKNVNSLSIPNILYFFISATSTPSSATTPVSQGSSQSSSTVTSQSQSAITPTQITISSIIPQMDLSEESEDDTVKKPIIPTNNKTFKLCDVCSNSSSMPTNTLLECEDCGKGIHQKCNRPEITAAQARDPRFLFVCCNCKDRDIKVRFFIFAEKSGSNNAASASTIPSTTTKPSTSVGSLKKEDKTTTAATIQKQTNDLSTAWATFAAKKKKPISSQNIGNSSASSSVTSTTSTTFGTRVVAMGTSNTKSIPSFINNNNNKDKK
ncbi:unnamed protein product [Anisakis simplex]|uniref:PHD-type domain-containing protein n=1 Tax=Anisakis simplex TaxID=6269 RepID=A0A3P6QK30_ANISI|nr:unnamed protein product [Anisakis simplex]